MGCVQLSDPRSEVNQVIWAGGRNHVVSFHSIQNLQLLQDMRSSGPSPAHVGHQVLLMWATKSSCVEDQPSVCRRPKSIK